MKNRKCVAIPIKYISDLKDKADKIYNTTNNFLCITLPKKRITFTEEILNWKLHFLCSVIFDVLLFHDSSFAIHQSHTFVGWHAIGINSSSIFFLHPLRCLNLLHQVIDVTRKILVG